MEGQLNIVQRVVKHPKYDMVIPENNIISAVRSNYLVGTFMMINGQQLGLGFWRTTAEKICALARDGAWLCSVTLDSDARRVPEVPPTSSISSTFLPSHQIQ